MLTIVCRRLLLGASFALALGAPRVLAQEDGGGQAEVRDPLRAVPVQLLDHGVRVQQLHHRGVLGGWGR